MENPALIEETSSGSPQFRWTRTRAEVRRDSAERSVKRGSMLLDMAGFALALTAIEEPDPIARQIKKNVIGQKLSAVSRWKNLFNKR